MKEHNREICCSRTYHHVVPTRLISIFPRPSSTASYLHPLLGRGLTVSFVMIPKQVFFCNWKLSKNFHTFFREYFQLKPVSVNITIIISIINSSSSSSSRRGINFTIVIVNKMRLCFLWMGKTDHESTKERTG